MATRSWRFNELAQAVTRLNREHLTHMAQVLARLGIGDGAVPERAGAMAA